MKIKWQGQPDSSRLVSRCIFSKMRLLEYKARDKNKRLKESVMKRQKRLLSDSHKFLEAGEGLGNKPKPVLGEKMPKTVVSEGQLKIDRIMRFSQFVFDVQDLQPRLGIPKSQKSGAVERKTSLASKLKESRSLRKLLENLKINVRN